MDDLSDPLGDRVMKDVPPIARWPLTEEQLYHNSSKYSVLLFVFFKFEIKKETSVFVFQRNGSFKNQI